MTDTENRKKKWIIIAVTLALALACMAAGLIRTNAYNSRMHKQLFEGEEFLSAESAGSKPVTVVAVPRDSTWTKIFDFDNEGLTEHNYQAYTYDFTVTNNTKDELKDFTFKLVFGTRTFLSSGWNGSVEIHQKVKDSEIVATVPDLREFDASKYDLKTYTVDGETLIDMNEGDYLIYTPSSSINAMEVPVEPHEATTPGFIMYIAIGEDVSGSSLELDYTFHRPITSDPLFRLSVVALVLWLISLIIFLITSAQIRKYNERHERDNEIINESIETFTGFIDAKDPYTNGHSKRVAIYTRKIAKELGFEGEELDRIYYVALLHDCGKIGVPDNILGKPGKLTDEEFDIIKSHTVRGGEILSSFKSLENAGEGALYHHERYDGRGYPEGRAGEDIPMIGRMICVADSFDAMNTNRVYRKRLSKDEIIKEIETNKGKQFDPKIADVMLKLLRNGEIKFD